MREMSASEPLVTHRNAFKTASELELHHCSRKSVAETYLLATRCPVYRRHDSHLGSCMELEHLSGDAKGISAAAPSAPSRRPATAKREAVPPAESRPAELGVQLFEFRRQRRQRFVHN